jgi:hypothetical protein
MNTIEQTLESAEKAGLRVELLEWVEGNKEWDPSLYSDQPAYYDMGLKILLDSTKQKQSTSFSKGYWNTEGHPAVTSTGIMKGLVEEYINTYNNNKAFLELESYAQVGQDAFVSNLLKQKRQGLFLDIGAGPPKFISNTYLLEKKYEWSGISIELDYRSKIAWEYSDRDSSNFLYENAFDVDYDKVLSSLLEKHNATRMDYLSIDLEPPHLTLEALYKVITSTKCRFSIITFEHDVWRNNEHILKASRELLKSHNYELVVDNINNQEDWYVDITY